MLFSSSAEETPVVMPFQYFYARTKGRLQPRKIDSFAIEVNKPSMFRPHLVELSNRHDYPIVRTKRP